jgi:outer membrane biosynthesis protein TonB
MTPYAVRIPRLRIIGLATVAALAFALAFVATHAGRTAAGSATPTPEQQLEQPAGSNIPDGLSAVAAIPVLTVKPAPSPPTPANTSTSTLPTASPQGTAPASPTPQPAATPEPAPAPAPASPPTPQPTSSPGTSFDDSG